jgi:hypothetical protein
MVGGCSCNHDCCGGSCVCSLLYRPLLRHRGIRDASGPSFLVVGVQFPESVGGCSSRDAVGAQGLACSS